VSQAYDLHVETQGGVYDLGRVVSVLALLDLTPTALTSYGDATGLQIEIQIAGDPQVCELCASRLQALVAVSSATLCATGSGREQWPCANASR
jgi:hypothetical protein